MKKALALLAFISNLAFAEVNLNTATLQELDAGLQGVGPAKAQAIVDYRAAHGPFKSLEDFDQVMGIGPKTLEKNKDIIVFDGVEAQKKP